MYQNLPINLKVLPLQMSLHLICLVRNARKIIRYITARSFLNYQSKREKFQIVKKAHLCINCLRSNSHQAKACNLSACRKCSKKHNTLLHLSISSHDNGASVLDKSDSFETEKVMQPIVTQCTTIHRSLSIILSTAIVHVYDFKNQVHSCRVLLDNGSQMNFITQELHLNLHYSR